MSTSNTISKIGAVCYIIWACLHLLAAYSVYVLGRSLDSSLVQGRVFQDAWNLLFFSIIAISVAATLNWKNSLWGYWINFATVAIADTGFIFFVLVSGYAPVWPSVLGPVFWVLATIFSTIALLTRTKGATRSLTLDNTAAGDSANAGTHLRRALAILLPLWQANPHKLTLLRDLANCYEELGKLAVAQSDWNEARSWYAKSKEL